jgi:natural product biosynthesis luciferase-like monooxygenase protein/amino acid adenylation domain-containing protein
MHDSELGVARSIVTLEREPNADFHVMGAAPNNAIPREFIKSGDYKDTPMSDAQARLWYLQQIEPQNVAFNESVHLRLAGPFDPNVLQLCIDEIVRRHEILRTIFLSVNGALVQRIFAEAPISVALYDLTALEDEALANAVEQYASYAGRTQFKLERGPLLTATLLRLSVSHHVLLITNHHIVSDAWSREVLLSEFATLYASFAARKSSPLRPLALQFADVTTWQREQYSGESYTRGLDYWRKRLVGAPELMSLNTDRPRPAIQSYRGRRQFFRLKPKLSSELGALARRLKASPYMVFLAAFATLLSRHGGGSDLVIGCPVANRPRPEMEALVGYFVNVLPIRLNLSMASDFKDLVKQARRFTLEGLAHQDVLFDRLVEAVHQTRTLNHTPIYQVMLNLRNMPSTASQASDFTIERLNTDNGTSRLDLTIDLVEDGGGYSGLVEYSTDLFDDDTVAKLILRFRRILELGILDPDASIAQMNFLTPKEHHQIIRDFNATGEVGQCDDCIHRVFERQVLLTPLAEAVVCGKERLTFADIDQRANALASRLRSLGVGPEVVVGLYANRSPNMIVGLLAILKSGGAYLPIDPSYPEQRILYMLRNSQARIIVVDESEARLSDLDFELVPIINAKQSESPPNSGVQSSNLAYVIYTSGSTGRPKGVMISHRSVVNMFAAMDSVVGTRGGDRWLAVTSIGFDISVLELLWTLSRGSTVVLWGDESRRIAETRSTTRSVDFSLFFFAADATSTQQDKYELLKRSAEYADANGFRAIWVPERHFHDFGGLYPSPAVIAAALAAKTSNLRIRAGSVVLPLSNPIRVAEEWSVVDNLSNGRVDLSFASGWHPDDFVLAAENYTDRRAILRDNADIVRRLWRGETIEFRGGTGSAVGIKILPRPLQAELPIWITASGDPETFRLAGQIGANVLTHLLTQTVEELAAKIAIYRTERVAHGHDGAAGRVTIMLHTFIGEDLAVVRETVRRPLIKYLRSSLDLASNQTRDWDRKRSQLAPDGDEADDLLAHAFERVFRTTGLLGTASSVIPLIERLVGIGVDEIACLIDFGVETSEVLTSLQNLDRVRRSMARPDTDVTPLAGLIRSERISHMQCTPSLARMEFPGNWKELPLLRKLLLGGETLSTNIATAIRGVVAERVYNMYGPTEATIYATAHELVNIDGEIPIGRPVNSKIYILDSFLQAVPIGVRGEIYIGGCGVARGYRGRYGETAAAFIPDPFSVDAGARMYRSGDVGSWRRDGSIAFHGRADSQAKVRGHRIEPGEIEAVLLEHPDVDSVVIVIREIAADLRIIAYVVGREGRSLSVDELRRYSAEQLTGYMIPSFFVLLSHLPISPNGKLDRSALLDPALYAVQSQDTTPACTELEVQLAGIWSQVVGIAEVGINDSFFEVGGHSFLAVRLIERIRAELGVELSLREFLQRPTIAGLAEVIERSGIFDRVAAAPSVQADVEHWYEPFPLTDVQQVYWIGRRDLFDLGNIACHFYVEFEGAELDLNRFVEAWRNVISRHDMLRAIIQEDGQQRVLKQVPPYNVAVLDLRDLDLSAAEVELDALRHKMSHQVIPTDRWPLFEMRVSHLADRWRIHLSIDTLIADGESVRIIYNDLASIYVERKELPPLSLSFRDYVLATEKLRGGERYRRAEMYWAERLNQLPPAPDLPLAVDPSQLKEVRFVRRHERLPAQQWRSIKARAAKLNISSSVLLLAAYSSILASWSESEDFTINVTLFNRSTIHPEVGLIVGDFTSLTLLEVRQARSGSFSDRCRRLRDRLWEDLDHREYSGVSVLRELSRARGFRSGVVVPIVFTSELDVGRSADEPSLFTPVHSISQTPQVWLDHQVREGEGGDLILTWDCVDALFPAGMLDDMFQTYVELLRDLADREASWTEDPLAFLPMYQRLQRAEVNATAQPLSNALLHDGFFLTAEREPDAVAIIAEGRRLTYGELVLRSGHLAAQLGSGSDEVRVVAIVMDKGWEQIAATIGVLYAGAAFLPIDASLPIDRISMYLRESAVKEIVTQFDLATRIDWPEGIRVIVLHDGQPLELPKRALRTVRTADDIAYVIFTSGSTGVPKGVVITHRSAVNTIHDVNRRFGIGPEDKVLSVSSFGFDLSVYDVFGLLAVGGAIVVPSAESYRSPRHWAELISRHGVTLWNSVPTAIELLLLHLKHGASSELASLRTIMLSGDRIPVTLPGRIYSVCPQCRVYSLGGATEASIWSIVYPIGPIPEHEKSIPYGRPMANQTFHILNDHLEDCPTWVPGQIFIGGIGLAVGYIGDEEKTRERFFIHHRSGERLYRTGDLGRYLPSGDIEFLGRTDLQVKVRGYRIELGEVEAALLRREVVREAVVIAVGEGSERELVACVVAAERKAGAPASDRGAIGQQIDTLRFLSQRNGRRVLAGDEPVYRLSDTVMDGDDEWLWARRTHRTFEAEPLPLDALAMLMRRLGERDVEGLPHRLYPSAGSLFAVQVFLYVKRGRVEGLAPGLYYHDPQQNNLALLDPAFVVHRESFSSINQPIFESAAFAIFMIDKPSAIEPVYGNLSRNFCFLEAGHLGQLLMSVAPSCRIGLCPVGGGATDGSFDSIGLEPGQSLIYSLLGGGVAVVDPERLTFQTSRLDVRLLQDLKTTLPEYMVPSRVVLLQAMPITANGKIDRQKLADVAVQRGGQASADGSLVRQKSKSSSGLLEQIAAVFCEVLNMSDIVVDKNIFDLGCNSMHLIRIHARVQDLLGRELPVMAFFEAPTIRAIVERIGDVSVASRQAPEASTKSRWMADGMRDRRRKSSRADNDTEAT